MLLLVLVVFEAAMASLTKKFTDLLKLQKKVSKSKVYFKKVWMPCNFLFKNSFFVLNYSLFRH